MSINDGFFIFRISITDTILTKNLNSSVIDKAESKSVVWVLIVRHEYYQLGHILKLQQNNNLLYSGQKKVRCLKVAVCSKQNSLSTDKSQTNLLPGSFSAAFAQSEDCGHVLAILPGASAPRSRAGEERADKN